MRALLKLLSPNKGMLVLSVPVSIDLVVWNLHRVYGKQQAAMLYYVLVLAVVLLAEMPFRAHRTHSTPLTVARLETGLMLDWQHFPAVCMR